MRYDFKSDFKEALDKMALRQNDLEQAHHGCQRELPEKYAPRDEVTRLWERTDGYGDRLSRAETRIEGLKNIRALRNSGVTLFGVREREIFTFGHL